MVPIRDTRNEQEESSPKTIHQGQDGDVWVQHLEPSVCNNNCNFHWFGAGLDRFHCRTIGSQSFRGTTASCVAFESATRRGTCCGQIGADGNNFLSISSRRSARPSESVGRNAMLGAGASQWTGLVMLETRSIVLKAVRIGIVRYDKWTTSLETLNVTKLIFIDRNTLTLTTFLEDPLPLLAKVDVLY
ncbi:hypothetical protein T265_10199 [Opisthorchis viverrini]|uniref:Uncharacterized protein n=1 Tax=Opisthorchis viverrini TaxID=6198 RepID=A0A075A255_OPIVI|nr:hypothetical protein T265_10199 [Opisthorchis viverrini]KER21484.1 hypothetical protein T265_10199 [Opisthorchis viverrini]